MKQIHKLSVLLVCLSLAACQAPTNLVGTSLGPKPDIAKSTIILDEKYVDDFNQGLFQNCLDDGKKAAT